MGGCAPPALEDIVRPRRFIERFWAAPQLHR